MYTNACTHMNTCIYTNALMSMNVHTVSRLCPSSHHTIALVHLSPALASPGSPTNKHTYVHECPRRVSPVPLISPCHHPRSHLTGPHFSQLAHGVSWTSSSMHAVRTD